MSSRTMKFVPFLSALIGGAVVAAVLLAVGTRDSTRTTTVVQQAPLASANATQTQSSSLTPRDIYKRDAPGVVFIRSQIVQRSQSPFDPFPQDQSGQATGSGIVLDKSGTILTNAHVIDNAVKVTVQFGDKSLVNAKVIGKDASDDIALLKVPTDGVTLTPLPLGDSHSVQVGDPTIAIGNPFGLDRTLTTGVVSALQRQIIAPNGFTIDNVIQTDAPINPGNSGGPLIDATGRVIGVNSQIETGGGQGSVGIGFAVPINTAKKIIPQLEKSGSVQQAYLGLTSLTIDGSLAQLNLPVKSGALVQSVQSGSGAAQAGIRGGTIQATVAGGSIALGGDIITAVDGQPVTTSDNLGTAIATKKPGDQVTLTIVRAGKRKDVKVTLGKRPDSVQNPNTPQG
jgi:S1-C subfamily serine protease